MQSKKNALLAELVDIPAAVVLLARGEHDRILSEYTKHLPRLRYGLIAVPVGKVNLKRQLHQRTVKPSLTGSVLPNTAGTPSSFGMRSSTHHAYPA